MKCKNFLCNLHNIGFDNDCMMGHCLIIDCEQRKAFNRIDKVDKYSTVCTQFSIEKSKVNKPGT